jgi:DNA-binding FadR family transcriptional regulator
MFERIQPRESAVDTCARALRRAIMGGDLSPGERLPPERKLAESFGVNRVTVRGALAQLANSRLVSVRQGSGYVVRDFRLEGGPDLIAGLAELASGKELATIAGDLLFVRRHLARAVLTRLADKRSVKKQAIAEAVGAFAEAVARNADVDELARADLAIVRALLDATGSPVLRLCMNPVQQVLARLPRLREAIYGEPEGNLIGWRALLAWLDLRDLGILDVIVQELENRDEATVAKLQKKRKSR